MVDVNVHSLNLGGYTVDRILNSYQPINPNKNSTLLTQKGIEDLILKMPGANGFPIPYQHKMNMLFDVLTLAEGQDYDMTYKIKAGLSSDDLTFYYPEDCLKDVNQKTCFLAANITDNQHNVRTFKLKNSPVEQTFTVEGLDLTTIGSEGEPGYLTYYAAFCIKTSDEEPFAQDTCIKLSNKFFYIPSSDGSVTIDNYILLEENVATRCLFADQNCNTELGGIYIQGDNSGWIYESDVCYLYVKAGTEQVVFFINNTALTTDNFDDWKNRVQLTPVDFTPNTITVGVDNTVEKIIVSSEIKDINFSINNGAKLIYRAPRLPSVTISTNGVLLIDESYIEAGLQQMEVEGEYKNIEVKNINVNTVVLKAKFFNGNDLTEAHTGDFGDWKNVTCNKFIVQSLGQVITPDLIKTLLNLGNGVGTIEIKDICD